MVAKNLLNLLFFANFPFHYEQLPNRLENNKITPQKGRGAQMNTDNRYQKLALDTSFYADIVDEEELSLSPKTQQLAIFPKTIVNKIPSPDIPMPWGINPYQGCEHGCTYCYARPTHEYWGYSAGNDFEQKILYKPEAANLLRTFFNNKKWVPEPILLSGNTDCYQPAERKFELTRHLLKVFCEYQNPVGIITKNALILRDIDLLKELNSNNLVQVVVSLTTINEEIRRKLEPRTSSVAMRLKAIKVLSENNIPVVAQMGPVIPGLTDHEIPDVVKAAAENGATQVSYILVRLNDVVATIFEDWVTKVFPDKANRILSNIKQTHGGKLGDTRFGTRMRGEGPVAEVCNRLFKMAQAKYCPKKEMPKLATQHFKRPQSGQLELF
ncbi:PA0069 family radical SAM protein [bacterium]|nr:PA0069 family radical SAM protein [bacterium]